jgi:hypothetical protein
VNDATVFARYEQPFIVELSRALLTLFVNEFRVARLDDAVGPMGARCVASSEGGCSVDDWDVVIVDSRLDIDGSLAGIALVGRYVLDALAQALRAMHRKVFGVGAQAEGARPIGHAGERVADRGVMKAFPLLEVDRPAPRVVVSLRHDTVS